VPDLPTHPSQHDAKTMLVLDFFLKRDFGAGKKAHNHVRLSDRGKATSECVIEECRYQFVSDLCRSGCNAMKTVVTH
jgi:hypothetical protein